MVESVALFLGLLLVIMGAIMIANKLKIAYPILLVILGLILSSYRQSQPGFDLLCQR